LGVDSAELRRGEVVEECASSLNRKCVGQFEEVLVTRDEDRTLMLGEG
jgi:hypothetical protein